MVEVEDLLAKVKVLQGRWPAFADAQTILVIGDDNSLLSRQRLGAVAIGDLVRLAAATPLDLLVSVTNTPAAA
ncbi:MAG TPA: hypothetical protein VGG41_18780 [Solirubrobacteraceae bacterium]